MDKVQYDIDVTEKYANKGDYVADIDIKNT